MNKLQLFLLNCCSPFRWIYVFWHASKVIYLTSFAVDVGSVVVEKRRQRKLYGILLLSLPPDVKWKSQLRGLSFPRTANATIGKGQTIYMVHANSMMLYTLVGLVKRSFWHSREHDLFNSKEHCRHCNIIANPREIYFRLADCWFGIGIRHTYPVDT